jgi:hypothetical protein
MSVPTSTRELNTTQTVNSYSFEICTLMGYYKTFNGITLKTFRDSLLVPFSAVKNSWFLKMGPIGCPKTPVRNYQHMLHDIPQECKSHILHDRSLKSLLLIYFTLWYYPLVLNSFMIIQAAYKYSCPDFKYARYYQLPHKRKSLSSLKHVLPDL